MHALSLSAEEEELGSRGSSSVQMRDLDGHWCGLRLWRQEGSLAVRASTVSSGQLGTKQQVCSNSAVLGAQPLWLMPGDWLCTAG